MLDVHIFCNPSSINRRFGSDIFINLLIASCSRVVSGFQCPLVVTASIWRGPSNRQVPGPAQSFPPNNVLDVLTCHFLVVLRSTPGLVIAPHLPPVTHLSHSHDPASPNRRLILTNSHTVPLEIGCMTCKILQEFVLDLSAGLSPATSSEDFPNRY